MIARLGPLAASLLLLPAFGFAGPGAGATVACSAASARVEEVVLCRATGLDADEAISVELSNQPITLASPRAGPDGRVGFQVRVPTVGPGSHTLRVSGRTSGRVTRTDLWITAPAAGPTQPATGDLPRRSAPHSSDTTLPVPALAAIFVAGGGLVVLAVRKRRRRT